MCLALLEYQTWHQPAWSAAEVQRQEVSARAILKESITTSLPGRLTRLKGLARLLLRKCAVPAAPAGNCRPQINPMLVDRDRVVLRRIVYGPGRWWRGRWRGRVHYDLERSVRQPAGVASFVKPVCLSSQNPPTTGERDTFGHIYRR